MQASVVHVAFAAQTVGHTGTTTHHAAVAPRRAAAHADRMIASAASRAVAPAGAGHLAGPAKRTAILPSTTIRLRSTPLGKGSLPVVTASAAGCVAQSAGLPPGSLHFLTRTGRCTSAPHDGSGATTSRWRPVAGSEQRDLSG